jgi:hypothetical protein
MRTTESLFAEGINDFCNKICQQRSFDHPRPLELLFLSEVFRSSREQLRPRRKFLLVGVVERRRTSMGKGLLLWLIGIPIPIILLLWIFGFLH